MTDNDLYDPSAERAIISGCVKYGSDVFVEVEDIVTDRSFYIDSNQIWYKCLRHIFEQDVDAKPDVPTLLSAAKTLGFDKQVDSKDEKQHLRSILNMPIEANNVRKLAVKVRKLEIARAGLEINKTIENRILGIKGDESIASIINNIESPIDEFINSISYSNDEPKTIGEDLEAYVHHLAENPVTQLGLPSGFYKLDNAIGGGLRKGSVTTVAARSGIGKTHIGMNISLSVAGGSGYQYPKMGIVDKIPVLFLDTEMGDSDHKNKNLANLADVLLDDIETGMFGKDKNKKDALITASKKLSSIPYYMKSIAGQPFEETLSIMKRWVKKVVGLTSNGKAKDCLIVFDYIKLMDSVGLSSAIHEFQALGFMMTALHNFAVKYQVPILCFVQMNRGGLDSEDTDAVSGSDRILWLTSNLIYYKLLSDEELSSDNGKMPYTHKFLIKKHRYGKGLKKSQDYILVKADYGYGRITEGPLKSEYDKSKSLDTTGKIDGNL